MKKSHLAANENVKTAMFDKQGTKIFQYRTCPTG